MCIRDSPLASIDDGSCVYSSCTSPQPTGLATNWITDTKAEITWDNMNDAKCMVFKYFVRYRVDNLDGTYGSWVTKSIIIMIKTKTIFNS